MISPVTQEGDDRRIRLRRLDDCLGVLEQAHELDVTVVTERIAEILSETVPTIPSGMLVAEAIESVLPQQESFKVQLRARVRSRLRHRRRRPLDRTLLPLQRGAR